MNWRPDDWVNPHDFRNPDHIDNPYVEMECANSYEAGASAMLSALLKYMGESCDNPAHLVDNRDRVDASRVAVIPLPTGKYKASYLHRKDCPQCMAELKESEK